MAAHDLAAPGRPPARPDGPGSDGPGFDGLYLGLISGTSADGIDAALVRFGADAGPRGCGLVAGQTFAWDPSLRERLLAIGQGGALESLDEYGSLDVRIGEAFAAAALALLEEAGATSGEVRAIGSHGQTLRHRPHGAAGDGRHPFTLQLGDGHVIAERTGITTVADFRRRDLAAGGHGAPLLPALHAALLADPAEDRAVLNLGGIANLTLLPAAADAGAAQVRGFDTGPANALLDAWCERHTGRPFDAGGHFAAAGTADPALLSRLLAERWFAQPPPKSSGREQFHLQWLAPQLRDESPADVQATLLELTAATVADALLATQPGTVRLLACGGGVHNPVLMQRLAARLPGIALESTAAHGLDPDHVEAMGFAWLARQALAGLPGNLPSVTGARGPRILGCVHPAVR